jgi:hypothetical protein
MVEAVRTSETSVNMYLTTRQYIPEDSELQSAISFNKLSSFLTLWPMIASSGQEEVGNSLYKERINLKMRAFCDTEPCSLVGIDRRFRGEYCSIISVMVSVIK